MSEAQSRPSRAERRRRSEQKILDAAREIFAEVGYQRSTIRAIAGAAEVDPALVMQYFGTKEQLFRQAVLAPTEKPLTADPERLAELVLDVLGVKLGEQPGGSDAAVRSMLTHPEAAAHVRESLTQQIQQASSAIEGEDAELRAALMLSTLLGVTLGRNLLELEPLRGATAERIRELLRPGLRQLADGRLTPR
ncbi:TetR/AcrR family transcriptional regulator [Amycolatopsis nigrescens]|uniref:TetR/AcrR family transcriptional regulator n=1 Tax=Amycolatopsis nigrescens TaxID=381445 RepID=UPI0003643D78|nr:TetR/AcrR family transcriptional regulator [Amycolatopsis nigrescens]